jgi:hypothetical protein
MRRSNSLRLSRAGGLRVRLGAPRALDSSSAPGVEIVSHDEIQPVDEIQPAAQTAPPENSEKLENPASPEEILDWIEIELTDEAGRTLADAAYEIVLADGSVREGRLSDGRVRLDGIPSGECSVKFPGLRDALAGAS